MKIKRVGNAKKNTAKCSKCGTAVKMKQIAEYHLDTAGLPNVWLLNIDGYECDNCHNRSVILPNYGMLMLLIVEILIFKNESYSNQELRFILKFFGIKGKELAGKLGTSQKTVSFWLNGKNKISPAYGIKLRKYLSSYFSDYLSERADKYEKLSKQIDDIVKKLNEKEEENYKAYLKHQAKLAVQRKLAEFELVNNVEVPTCKIPYSNARVQLRYL